MLSTFSFFDCFFSLSSCFLSWVLSFTVSFHQFSFYLGCLLEWRLFFFLGAMISAGTMGYTSLSSLALRLWGKGTFSFSAWNLCQRLSSPAFHYGFQMEATCGLISSAQVGRDGTDGDQAAFFFFCCCLVLYK